jgi:hypothetical protein
MRRRDNPQRAVALINPHRERDRPEAPAVAAELAFAGVFFVLLIFSLAILVRLFKAADMLN